MNWRALLNQPQDRVVLPWLGGALRAGPRTWTIQRVPPEHGWFTFAVTGRRATVVEPAEPDPRVFTLRATGYMVGSLFLPDDRRLGHIFCPACRGWYNGLALDCPRCRIPTVAALSAHLVPPLERFTRVEVGRTADDAPMVFHQLQFPVGPESDVQRAFEDRITLDAVKGVCPTLAAAFRLESWYRADIERRRAEADTRRAEAERRAALQAALGDGAGRRAMAAVDFGEAAKAALRVGGAELLDWRQQDRDRYVVRYRLAGRRFECVCDSTLHIADAGICLTAHYDDTTFEQGTCGDTWFTLESLPGVVLEAIRNDVLVVFRH